MTTQEPLISVIIPVYSAADTLAECLTSVYASSYRNIEVIVVDDNSQDNSVQIAAKFPCTLLQMPAQRGAASARNRGSARASGEILFFTDADVKLKNDTLEKAKDTFVSQPSVAAVVGDYTETAGHHDFYSRFKNLFHHYTHQTASEETTTFFAGCSAIKKDVFEKVGKFVERKGATIEDIELGYKLYKQGYRCFLNKSMQATHLKKYSFWNLVMSDVLNRAIPWTKLMLREKIVKNDLNTRTNNILSTIVVYLYIVLCAVFLWFSLYKSLIGLTFLTAPLFIGLNRDFAFFILKRTDGRFTAQSLVMLFFCYFYSGLALVMGISGYVYEEIGSRLGRTGIQR